MAPKTKKSKQQNKNSLITIIVVIVVLAAVSIITGWYFSDKNSEKNTTPDKEQTAQTETKKQDALKTPIEGTWVSNYDGAMLSITGLSFCLDLASVDKSVTIKGTILVKDDLVTLINKNGICKDVQGQYKFTIKGKDLTFSLVNDKCASRKERMTAGWFRL
jgi:uncharacterized ion transporter superfamily protein YfcC